VLKPDRKIVLRELCLALVGKPYTHNEVNLNAIKQNMSVAQVAGMIKSVDCSELVQVAYKLTTGKVFVDLASNQYIHSEEIKPRIIGGKKVCDLATGDLCFLANNPDRPNSIGHVGIYIGTGKIVEAKGKDYGVVLSTVDEWEKKKTFAGWRRPRI